MARATPQVPQGGFVRCPLCYGRVRLNSVSRASALYSHELSGTCSGHPPSPPKPSRKSRREREFDESQDSSTPPPRNARARLSRLNDWAVMFDDR